MPGLQHVGCSCKRSLTVMWHATENITNVNFMFWCPSACGVYVKKHLPRGLRASQTCSTGFMSRQRAVSYMRTKSSHSRKSSMCCILRARALPSISRKSRPRATQNYRIFGTRCLHYILEQLNLTLQPALNYKPFRSTYIQKAYCTVHSDSSVGWGR